MANLTYNGAKAGIMGVPTTGTPAAHINLTVDTVKVMLLSTASVVASETSVSGYTGGFGGAGRKALASVTLQADDANDRALFDAADVTWTALGAGQTLAYAVLFKELTSDALSPLIALFDFTDTPTNGGDITLVWSTSPSAVLVIT
jgi:hypothetical protein